MTETALPNNALINFSDTEAITSPANPQFFQDPSNTNNFLVFLTESMIKSGLNGFSTLQSIISALILFLANCRQVQLALAPKRLGSPRYSLS